jgi:hypothetical protein
MRILVELTGTTPLLMHNEQLSDSDNPVVKQIKELTDKSDQTESDKKEISRLEWRGGLYTNGGDEVVVPAKNLIKCFREAASETREGKKVAKTLSPLAMHYPLVHSGPGNVEELFKNPIFIDKRQVKVGTARIKRTRPIFPQWALTAEFMLSDTVMNFSAIKRVIELAGASVGLCDARILGHGRFEANVKKV